MATPPNLVQYNLIAEAFGGEGDNMYNIDALNEIAQIVTGESGFTRNLAALQAIAGGIDSFLPRPTDLVVTVNTGDGTYSSTWTPALGSSSTERSLNGEAWEDLGAATSETDVEAAEGVNTVRYRGVYAGDARGGIATRTFESIAFGGATLAIEWDDNSGIEDGFRIEWGTNGTTFPGSATVAADVETYEITGLAYNTLFYVRVYATRSGFPDSDVLGPIAVYTAPEDAPTSLTSDVENDTILIGWTPPDPIPASGGYRIYGGPTGDAAVLIGTASAGATSYLATELENETEYTFFITSFNDNGAYGISESPASADLVATSGIEATAPQVNAITIEDSTTLLIEFDEPVELGADAEGITAASDSGLALGLAYLSGDGTAERRYTITGRSVYSEEVITVTHTQAGDGLQDLVGNVLGSFSQAVTFNESELNAWFARQDFNGGIINGETWGGSGLSTTTYATSPAPLEGTHSLQISGSNAVKTFDFSARTHFWFFFRFVKETSMPTSNFGQIVYCYQSDNVTTGFQLEIGPTSFRLGSAATSAGVAAANTVYYVWGEVTIGGVSRMWISDSPTRPTVDGGSNFLATRSFAAAGPLTRFALRNPSVSATPCIFDTVVLSDIPILTVPI